MPAVVSPNPKRVRVFMRGGQLYEGGIEAALGAPLNMGGYRNPTSLSRENGVPKENQAK